MKNRFALSTVALLGLAGTAMADIAVPNAGPTAVETTASSGINTILRSAPRSYQSYYSAANFTAITSPTTFTGVQFRLALQENWRPAGYVGSTWPAAPLNIGSYEITLAKPSAGLVTDGEYLSTTPTFASYLSSPVVVYSGALTIPAGAFTANASGVAPWGFTIPFLTNYTQNPGDGLVMQIRLSGYTPNTAPQAFFASTGFSNGFTDAISSTASASAAAPNGFSSPVYANFVTIPTPGAMALLGLGGLMAGRRRR
jgi:hypothetical protein